MKNALISRGLLVGTVVLVVLGISIPSAAEDLGVLRAHSLNKVFDGIEAVSKAAGHEVDRQMLMGMAAGMLGIEPSEFLDLDRPVAVVLPVEGMMLEQNGLVAAVPVSDVATAIEALSALFGPPSTEGALHTFAMDQGPVLYILETEDYLRIGGDSDLLTRYDPLAGPKPTSALSLEIFLEPIVPMIEMGLQNVKDMATAELQGMPTDEQEMPYNPEAVVPIIDLYAEGVQSMLANTSSIRLALDVERGFVRFTKSLIPKPGSPLAGFIADQKGGLPKIAHLADEEAAIYMAGSLTLNDEVRRGVKAYAESYLGVMDTMFGAQGEGSAGEDAEAEDPPAKPAFWDEYIAVTAQFTDRWVDCWRGDLVMSFDFAEGRPFRLTEAFGMNAGDGCRDLVAEMGKELSRAAEDSDELAAVYSVSDGPQVGDSSSLLMTLDMMKMVDEMGQPLDENAAAAMKAIYGEKMNIAMSTVGGYTLVTAGENAAGRLGSVVASLDTPANAPSFAPLSDDPGYSMVLNLGRILAGIKDAVPEAKGEIEDVAAALSGEAGRIPMGLKFDSESASFELAVSLKTIEVIAAIAEEQRMKAAAAEPEPEMTDEGGD